MALRRLISGRHPEDVVPTLTVAGIDLAQRHDHPAFALVTATLMPDGVFWKLRHMERLPVGMAYHKQVEHFAVLLARFGQRLEAPGLINLDVSGVGRPVGEDLADAIDGNRWALQFCTIIAGWRVTPPGLLPRLRWPFLGPSAVPPPPDPFARALGRPARAMPGPVYATPHERVVGKSALVIGLQKVVQQQRLTAPARRRRYLTAMAEELEDFRGEIVSGGEVRAGARSGKHDDLVVSLGLACLDSPGDPREAGSRIRPAYKTVTN